MIRRTVTAFAEKSRLEWPLFRSAAPDWRFTTMRGKYFQLLPTIRFDFVEREAFRSGRLPRQWASQYNGVLFDDHDLSNATHQPNLHFWEWFAAIEIHRATGYHCLMQKYRSIKHVRKRDIFLPRASRCPGLVELIDDGRPQPPDLFLFSPENFDDWRFCEVKGPTDRLRESQRVHFQEIAGLSAKPIFLAQFENGVTIKSKQMSAKIR